MEVGKEAIFFHVLDLTVLNSFCLLTLCVAKMTHRQFRLALVQNLIEEVGSLHCLGQPRGRPVVLEIQAARFVVNFSNHLPDCTAMSVLHRQ
jgi:hypothetical protein